MFNAIKFKKGEPILLLVQKHSCRNDSQTQRLEFVSNKSQQDTFSQFYRC